MYFGQIVLLDCLWLWCRNGSLFVRLSHVLFVLKGTLWTQKHVHWLSCDTFARHTSLSITAASTEIWHCTILNEYSALSYSMTDVCQPLDPSGHPLIIKTVS